MNSLGLVLVSAVLLFLAYRFYARKLESIWQIDPKRATPAFSKFDSIDYIPAKNWLILFGHHFSSIAGAGPIIGPVLALTFWGWLPALLWVLIGSIFIGGVHDFGSLIISVREGGSSVADVASQVISVRAKLIFSIFVWLALVLIIAVFAYFCADTFVKEPKIVLPSLGLIPVAMLFGYLVYNAKLNNGIATVFGLACLSGLVLLGNIFPVNASIGFWMIFLFVYCFLASILPVNLLLQPRDYLSSCLLFLGVACGYAGILITRPKITVPAFTQWSSSGGYLWPALFITVACGAVSGFHALVASGTTSKQIASERHIKRIGYGGMLTEAVVALMSIIAVGAMIGANENLAAVLEKNGPIALFGRGYGNLTKSVLCVYGSFVAITILNSFILTTLDTAARIGRYLTSELFKINNRYFSTALVVGASAALAFSGEGQKIWQAFGAANQLMAALALFVIGAWLIAKNKSAKIAIVPAIFMFVTAIAALSIEGVKYFRTGKLVLAFMVAFLIVCAGVMAREVVPVLCAKENK